MKVLLALVAAAALPVATGDFSDYRGPDYCAGAKGTGLDRKVATTLINRRVHRSSVSQSEKRMTAELAIGFFDRFLKIEKDVTGTKGYVKASTHSLATLAGAITLVIAYWDLNTLIEFFTKADDITKPILFCASCVALVFGLYFSREWSED